MTKPKEILLYDEPPKKNQRKLKKKRRDKNKNKRQKQNVKQNVEVKVQSSGGTSGGGGGFIPSQFQDRTGENIRIQNLIDTLQKQAKKEQIRPPGIPSIFSEEGGEISIKRRPNLDTEPLYNRISNNNNKIDDAVDAMQYASSQVEEALSSGDIYSAIDLNDKIDSLDDEINNLNDENRADVISSSPRGRKPGSKNMTPVEQALKANAEIQKANLKLQKQIERDRAERQMEEEKRRRKEERLANQQLIAEEKALKLQEKRAKAKSSEL